VARERALGTSQVIGVMVAIALRQHLDRHSEIAGGLPHVGGGLHEPRRRRMAQNVRRDIPSQASISDVGESLVHALHGAVVPLNGEALPDRV
jgi:hypothetical protein